MSDIAELDAFSKRNKRFRAWMFRSSIGLVGAIVLLVTWWSWRAQSQRATVAEMERMGVQFQYLDLDGNNRPEWQNALLDNDWLGSPQSVNASDGLAKIDDRTVERFCNFPRLKYLDLSCSQVSDSGLARLTSLRKLRSLGLSATNVDDQGLANLPKFRHLVDLSLAHTGITDESVDSLAQLPNLEQLDLRETLITSAGFARLQAALPATEIIWTQSPTIAHCRACTKIMQAGGGLSASPGKQDRSRADIRIYFLESPLGESVGKIQAYSSQNQAVIECLPDIDNLAVSIKSTGLAPDHWGFLQQLDNLTETSLTLFQVSDRDLIHLADFPKVRVLNFPESEITDAGLIHLSKQKELRYLVARKSKITSRGLRSLVDLPQLEHLDVADSTLDDEGLEVFVKFGSLKELYIEGTGVTDEGLVHLVKMRQLQVLSLRSTKITDAGLVHLHGLSQLKVLLVPPEVTSEGIAKLKEALPDLGVN